MRKINRFICAVLSLIFASGFFAGCDFERGNTESDKALLEDAAATITLPAEVDDDIIWPVLSEDKFRGVTLSFSSSNTNVITNSGVVKRQDEDKNVTITAKFSINSSNITKPFTVKVIKFTTGESPAEQSANLTLDKFLIFSENSDSEVRLKLQIKGMLECNTLASSRQVDLLITSHSQTEQSVLNPLSGKNFDFILDLTDYLSVSAVTCEFSLLLLEDGELLTVPIFAEDILESVSYGIKPNTINPYSAEVSKTMAMLKVTINPSVIPVSGAQSNEIRCLSDTQRLKNSMSNISTVSSNISLPSKISGGYNSNISWSSSNSAVLSNTGAVSRPSIMLENAAVTLTATVTSGQKIKVSEFNVTVLKNSAYSAVQTYTTSDSLRFSTGSNLTVQTGGPSTNVVTLDLANQGREIEGFGGMMSHGSAYLINNSAQKNEILSALFTDAGFNMVRLPIGASDFPTYVGGVLKNFSLCETESAGSDKLENFSIDIDEEDLIPIIKASLQINPDLKFIGTPWSAPGFMKTYYSAGESDMCGGQLAFEYESLYADYLVKYVTAYANHGINIQYLSIQNEPGAGSKFYPTMWMSSAQQVRVADLLAAKLTEKGLSTKIIILDHNSDMFNYADEVLSGVMPETLTKIAGVGLHGYAIGTTSIASFMSTFYAKYPNQKIYFTEMTAHNGGGTFGNNLNWALKNIIFPMSQNGGAATLYFNFTLDEAGMPFIRQDWMNEGKHMFGLITLNSTNGALTKEAEYYALQHFSKFTKPVNGILSKTINTIHSVANLYTSATQQADGRVSITIYNDASARTVSLKFYNQYITVTLGAYTLTTLVFS